MNRLEYCKTLNNLDTSEAKKHNIIYSDILHTNTQTLNKIVKNKKINKTSKCNYTK